MKEALIAGAAVFLLSYLFVTILIKISRVIDRYKMKKKTDKIKVGQRKDTNTKATSWIHLKEASI